VGYSEEEAKQVFRCPKCGSLLAKKFTVPTARANVEPHLPQSTPEPPKQHEQNGELQRVAQNLRLKVEKEKEYQIIPEPENQVPEGFASEGYLFNSEYDQALKLKTELTRKYAGKQLEKVIAGEVVSNPHGQCYCITENHKIRFQKPTATETKQRLLSELKLLSGIGPAREQTLKQQGYPTIESLRGHPRWQRQAKDFLKLVEDKDVSGLQEQLRQRLPKSHPLVHYLAGFCQNKKFAIIDVETLGLFGRPIILVGAANIVKSKICTRQFLVRDISEEASALWEFVSTLNGDSVLVSYNGRCFDAPFIRERLAYYGLQSSGLESDFGVVHFDVLHFARRALRGRFRDCRLETLEPFLGVHRDVNIPGALVPEFYDAYQKSGNVGPLVAIVEHNKQDLVTLALLFCSLYREWQL
jgi:uncharacterized protein YprB with RNaseH-like and TPR domain